MIFFKIRIPAQKHKFRYDQEYVGFFFVRRWYPGWNSDQQSWVISQPKLNLDFTNVWWGLRSMDTSDDSARTTTWTQAAIQRGLQRGHKRRFSEDDNMDTSGDSARTTTWTQATTQQGLQHGHKRRLSEDYNMDTSDDSARTTTWTHARMIFCSTFPSGKPICPDNEFLILCSC